MIAALRGGKAQFVPFRESALTMLMKDALAGNCRTCLVVTVAAEAEMAHESAAAAQFGLSCGRIRTNTTADVRDADAELRLLAGRLRAVDAELAAMRARGMAGFLCEGHPKPTQDAFVGNFRQLRLHEDRLRAEKAKGTKASGKQLEFCAGQILHFKNMLVRQLTTGIFKEAAPQFVARLSERRALQSEISRLSQVTFPDEDVE